MDMSPFHRVFDRFVIFARDHGAPLWLVAICAASIVLGAVFRFSNLDTKIYMSDETVTSMHVAGYTLQEFRAQLRGNQAIDAVEMVRRFQGPRSHRGAQAIIHALETSDPQHPPVYYLAEWQWQRWFGDSVHARRILSAIFGTLAIGAVFWLSFELFSSASFAWLSAAIVAVSPFQVIYSQQAREFSLFALVSVLSSGALLHALRRNTLWSWVLFALVTTLMLYTAVLGLVLVTTFLVYVLFRERARWTRPARGFVVSAAAAVALYAPWLFVAVANRQNAEAANGWWAVALSPKIYVAKLVFAVGSVFFDAEYSNVRFAVFLLPIFALLAYALWTTLRARTPNGRVFILSLVAVNALLFLGSDILLKASRATQIRYLFLTAIGLELALAYGLILAASSKVRRTTLASGSGIVIVLALGIFSCAIEQPKSIWWTNISDARIAKAASYIDYSKHALVLTTPDIALKLCDFARSDPKFAFVVKTVGSLHRRSGDIYAVGEDSGVLARAESQMHLRAIPLNLDVAEQRIVKDIHRQVRRLHRALLTPKSNTTAWRLVPQ